MPNTIFCLNYQSKESNDQNEDSYEEFLTLLSKQSKTSDGVQLKHTDGPGCEMQKMGDAQTPTVSTGRCPFLHGTGKFSALSIKRAREFKRQFVLTSLWFICLL